MIKQLLLSLVLVLCFVSFAHAIPGQVAASPTITGVPRTGYNIGAAQYNGPAFYYSNVLRNTGFEAIEAGRIVELESATSTLACEINSSFVYQAGFFNAATFEVIYSTAAPSNVGLTGIINTYTPAAVACTGTTPSWVYTATFTLHTGDLISVHQTRNPLSVPAGCSFGNEPNCGPVAGWWYPATDAQWTTGTQNPNTVGSQSLQLNLDGSTHTISQFFDQNVDSTQIQNYFPINGSWKFNIWTEAVSATAPSCTATLTRGLTTYFTSTWTPSSTWAQTTVNFTGADTTSTVMNQVQLALTCSGSSGSILVDDGYLGSSKTTTTWRKQLTSVLQTLNPGILRDNQGNQGNSVANWTSAATARKITYFQGPNSPVYDYSMAEFFLLTSQALANPWVVIPVDLTDSEYTTIGTSIASLQATDHFSKIYVEFGNENWNSASCGGTCFTQSGVISQAAWTSAANRAYGLIAVGAALGSTLQFVGNGQWGSNPPDDTQMLSVASACPNCNIIDAAPFWYRCQDTATSTATNLSDLFNDPEQDNSQSIMTTISTALSGASMGTSFYEMGPSVLGGSATSSQRTGISAGGASAPSEAQTALRAFTAGITPVASWQLTQLDTPALSSYSDCANNPPANTTVTLWGDVYYLDTPQYRPRALGLEMLNQYGIGSSSDFYSIANLPSGVTGGAFLQSDGWHVVVTNSGAVSQTVTITFPDATHSLPSNFRQIQYNNVTDTNETISTPLVTISQLQSGQITKISSTQISFVVSSYGETAVYPVPAPPPVTSLVSLNRGIWYIGDNDDSTFTVSKMPYGGVGLLARITGRNLWTTVGSPSSSQVCSEDWTELDAYITNALSGGYMLALDIDFGGFGTPDCEINKLQAQTPDGVFQSNFAFQRTFSQQGNTIVPCSAYQVPVPWSTTYQADLAQFLKDLNTHLVAQGVTNIIPRIDNTAITTNDDEISMPAGGPSSVGTITCNGATWGNTACQNAVIAAGGTWNSGTNIGTCPIPNDAANWITPTYQYTPAKVIAAQAAFDQAFHAALPLGCVSHMWLPNRFPAIGNNGAIIAGQVSDMPYPNIPIATVTGTNKQLPNFYCNQSNNLGLVAGLPRPNQNIAGSTLPLLTMLGFQSDGATVGNYNSLAISLNNALNSWGANWIELYTNNSVWNKNVIIQWSQSEMANAQHNYNQ